MKTGITVRLFGIREHISRALSSAIVVAFLLSPTSTGWAKDRQKPSAVEATVTPLARWSDSVRIAVAQIVIDQDKLPEGQSAVAALIPWIDRAVDDGVDLIVFPEYLLGHFHLPDALTEELCAAARERKINVIVGGWEQMPGTEIQHPPKPGTYANSVLVIDRQGRVAGKHRKLHAAVGGASPYCWPPDPGELGENTMVKGTSNAVVELDFGRIGLLTCYDGYFFESFEMASLRGAEILVWVNARMGRVEPHIVKAASFLTCTHVVASNQAVGTGSAICSYPGWALDATVQADSGEGYIVSDLDLEMLRDQRRNNRMFHQRRPEIYGPIAQEWRPWEAYPHIEPYRHASEGGPAASAE